LTTVVVRRKPTCVEQREEVLLSRRVPSGLAGERPELLEAHVGHGSGAKGRYPCRAPLTRAAFRTSAHDALDQHKEGQAQEKADRSNYENS
jgi:hypothetical protein